MAEWSKRYRVRVVPVGWNVGVDEVVDSVDLAASLAALVGAPHRYLCDDGRWFLYRTQEDCDAGTDEVGSIEMVALG
jgi:hypothetical protein